MQTAGDTAMPTISELLLTTVASASVLAPLTTQEVAKKQPRTGGYNKRSCQGSSHASMVARQESTTNEQARLSDVADGNTGDMVLVPVCVVQQQQPDDDAHYMCSTCRVPLINRDTNQGQLYRPVPNSHELLTTRQIIHAAWHNPTRTRHMVPVCYCCLTNMMMKAYLDLLAIQRDTPGAIEEYAILYGIDRQAPP